MRVIVQKFGGKCVEPGGNELVSAERIMETRDRGYFPVVVVSAMGRELRDWNEEIEELVRKPEGARQLAHILAQLGHTSAFIDVRQIHTLLHLKTGLTSLGDGRLAVIDALADHPALRGYELVRTVPGEEYAANCIRVNDYVVLAAGFPAFEKSVRDLGHNVIAVAMSEFSKQDGGLSCLSLRF